MNRVHPPATNPLPRWLFVAATLAACAASDPGWGAGHPADPAAATAPEVPVATPLREPAIAPPVAEPPAAHHHPSDADTDSPPEEPHADR